MSVTNLNKVRKARALKDKRARADENSVVFGRTKSQKALDTKQKSKAIQKLDEHKRER